MAKQISIALLVSFITIISACPERFDALDAAINEVQAHARALQQQIDDMDPTSTAAPQQQIDDVSDDIQANKATIASLTTDVETLQGSQLTVSDTDFDNRPPYLGINYIIALVGLYPSRNRRRLLDEPHIGEIVMFGGNFAPRGWAFCDGQLLAISSNSALFSLLGTTYGGDGRTTFGLPDLRGRVSLHSGNGPGLSSYTDGQKTGQETLTIPVASAMQGAPNIISDQNKQLYNDGNEWMLIKGLIGAIFAMNICLCGPVFFGGKKANQYTEVSGIENGKV